MSHKILFSNIGYAKGIDGSLKQHIYRVGRHFYCQVPTQQKVLRQLKDIIVQEDPDICCLVEIDQGSFHSGYFNQMHALIDDVYTFHDIADKYGENSSLGRMPLYIGKSNGFLAKQSMPFERLYLNIGTKRLVYRLKLADDVHLFFAHFALKKNIRRQQFSELQKMIEATKGDVIVLADFNVLTGFAELNPLIDQCGLNLLNNENDHTFTFHTRKLALDLCLCSKNLADRLKIKIIPQDFSDHDALMIEY